MSHLEIVFVVGMVERRSLIDPPDLAVARERGEEWLEEQRYDVQYAIDAGDTEAASYPTYFAVRDLRSGADVYRSDRPDNAP